MSLAVYHVEAKAEVPNKTEAKKPRITILRLLILTLHVLYKFFIEYFIYSVLVMVLF